MKNLFLTVVLYIACISLSSAQKSVETETNIDNVTVYLQGAEINVRAKVSVGEGETEIVFKGLPNTINAQTIQLSATNDIVILSVSSRPNYLAPKKEQEEIKRLQDSIDVLDLRLSKISNRKSVLNGLSDMLAANKDVAGANVGVNPDNLTKVFDYYNDKMMKIKSELLELDLSQKKIKKLLSDYKEEMNDKNSSDKWTNEVVALVSSKTQQTVNFNLGYLITNAGWTPEYDIRGENISTPVKLTYKANVWQGTGINWDKVKLKISTGNPNQSAQGPLYSVWYLDYYYPASTVALQWSSNAASNAMNGTYKKEEKLDDTISVGGARGYNNKYYVDGIPMTQSESGADYTAIANNQLAAIFDIDIPYSIAGDGKPHMVIVEEKTWNTKYEYYCIPKSDPDVFLLARINDWESLNLLSADANVFFEGAYVGQTHINANITKDTLNISLGRDKKIVVKRTKVKDFDKNKIMGDKVKKSVGYEIDVKNTRSDKVDIDVFDQLPISKNNEITVELDDAGGAIVNNETGKLTWKYSLNPGEDRKVRFAYSVKYPKAKEINAPEF